MNTNLIMLNDVNLHYASLGYKERSLKSLLSQIGRRSSHKTNITDIHALKNIRITIREGERVGLIGHNGAGKSTLLKTIAGLYPISSGERTVVGQIRSLFDLSLGFEPDATGRENILYRGLLLGLHPSFIRKKIDDIIAFADLGDFIDYPIKTYSAGMQVRLAFAISTTVGGDILLLDEVIGAGDANFMAKAKERILQLIKNSNIMILASHDIHSLKSLCHRALVLHHGTVVFDGAVDDAVSYYETMYASCV